ncbi:hypothetical protein TNCV_3850591 [Trichonephila clavipes]|nr:hypothetical protein TNCV_3850591 [Trichonephila clavipes]
MSSRHHIDDFMRGRIIGKIEEERKITDVAREFDIAHSVVSRLWKSFKSTGMCRSHRSVEKDPLTSLIVILVYFSTISGSINMFTISPQWSSIYQHGCQLGSIANISRCFH